MTCSHSFESVPDAAEPPTPKGDPAVARFRCIDCGHWAFQSIPDNGRKSMDDYPLPRPVILYPKCHKFSVEPGQLPRRMFLCSLGCDCDPPLQVSGRPRVTNGKRRADAGRERS